MTKQGTLFNEPDNHNPAADAELESDLGDAAFRADEAPRFAAPCRVHFHHVRKRLADLDNLCVKAVIDGLVQAGVFPNDTPQFIAEITHSQSQGDQEKTIVTIETV